MQGPPQDLRRQGGSGSWNNLTIEAGQCYGLLGPNGAGKTTTIEILEGLLDATSGAIEILGRTRYQHPAELRESLAVSLQESRLAEKLSVRETLELFGGFYRNARPVDEVLDELALTEKADAWVHNRTTVTDEAATY